MIVFVGSVISEDTKELVKLAKKMKKNNVAVDFINFGEETENTEKLEKFIEGVNSGDNSHLVTIPPGPHLLSDILITSPIINEDSGVGGIEGSVAQADGGDLYEFGIDPSVDPELALALRMSMEDEKARQEKEKKEREEKQAAESGAGSSTTHADAVTEEADSGSNKKDTDGDDHMEL